MKIVTGIASTTHVDYYNERMAKSVLDGFAYQIRTSFIPFLVDHDPNKQIGILLFGKVAQLDDGEFALYVACGIFENEEEANKHQNGQPNIVWGDYQHFLEHIEDAGSEIIPEERYKNLGNKIDNLNLAQLLEKHLDSTKIRSDGAVYKVKFLVASTNDLQISVYPKDHAPKHFHLTSKQRRINAKFDINTLELINTKNAKIRIGDIRKIQNFFELRPEILE